MSGRALLLIVLLLLVAVMAFAKADAISKEQHHVPKALYANDRIKIKLTQEAMNIGELPKELDEIVYNTTIPSIDMLCRQFSVSKIALAHRELTDKDWETLTGFDRWFLFYLPPGVDINAVIEDFKGNPYIERVTHEYLVYTSTTPNDTYYPNNWGHNNTAQLPGGQSHTQAGVGTVGFDTDVDEAWSYPQGYGSPSVVVAIIDSGVDIAHPDLTMVTGYDYGDNDANPDDDSADPGHGTSCAGIATATTNNGIGVAGVAGGSVVMPLKIADSEGTMSFTSLENAITHAADNGADIISMSLGASVAYGDSPGTDTAIQYSYNNGLIIFAATGNDNVSTVEYPGCHPNVIAVGAASPCGQRKSPSSCDDEDWWGANYGTTSQDAAGAVDICAPTILPATDIHGAGGYSSGDYVMFFNGTSCATPYAAGVAALVLSAQPNLTPAQVRQVITSTATDMTLDGGTGWDRYTGYGLVNARDAVASLTTGTPTCQITAPQNNSIIFTGQDLVIDINASDQTRSLVRVEITISGPTNQTYTDYSQPYGLTISTASMQAGAYTINAVAFDDEDNQGSDIINFMLLEQPDEGFESGDFSGLAWQHSGDANWQVITSEVFSGTYAACSGDIGNSQTSQLSMAVNCTESGAIAFYSRVSSEENYDWLRFYIDGELQNSWSGQGSWGHHSYNISSGYHEFSWVYTKDSGQSDYNDCAYLDHITLPAFEVVDPAQVSYSPANFNVSLGAGQSTDATLQVGNTGDIDLDYTISTNSGSISRAVTLSEGFEGGVLPSGWSSEYITGTVDWVYQSGGSYSNPTDAYQGNFNAMMYNNSTTGVTTKLITPAMDLGIATQATLTFYHTQAAWNNDQDYLRVYYRTASNQSWVLLIEYVNSTTDWTLRTISLPELSASYSIAFEGEARYGYGVCLDNIEVTTSGGSASDWLTVNNATSLSGTISAGSSSYFSIGLSAANLAAGIFSGSITIESNSATDDNVTIPVSLTVSDSGTPVELIYSWNLDTNPIWDTQGAWAFGMPGGGGGDHGFADPSSAHTGNYVYGYNLSGDYANDMSPTYLTTTAIDCSSLTRTQLRFWRWLNVEGPEYDHAAVQVSTDGANWTQIWTNEDTIADDEWTQQVYDIGNVADGQPTVYVRWVMGATDDSWVFSGWNIDDIEIWGEEVITYLPAPTQVEISSSESLIKISWNEVAGAQSYKVYYTDNIDNPYQLVGQKAASAGAGRHIWNGTNIWTAPGFFRVVASTDEAGVTPGQPNMTRSNK